jgi:hypothetical protein
MKVRIRVHKAFELNQKDRESLAFGIGIHTVEQEVADHWYAKAHSELYDAKGDAAPDDEKAEATEGENVRITELEAINAKLAEELASANLRIAELLAKSEEDGAKSAEELAKTGAKSAAKPAVEPWKKS